MTTNQTTNNLPFTLSVDHDAMVDVEWALNQYLSMICDDDDDVRQVMTVNQILGYVNGTLNSHGRYAVLTLTQGERLTLLAGLTAWRDNLIDDEGDGADHFDEIVKFEYLIDMVTP